MELKRIRDTDYFVSEYGELFNRRGNKLSSWVENNTGYTLFRIYINGKAKCYRLHRIVAECWIPNPDKLPFVKHKNDDKTNNRARNLEWGANPDNVQEGYDNGCYRFRQRSHKVKVKNLETGETVVYKSIRSLSDEIGLNRKNVAAVLKSKKNNTYSNYEFSYEMPND